jgi:hypothetical protein
MVLFNDFLVLMEGKILFFFFFKKEKIGMTAGLASEKNLQIIR